MKAWLEPKDMEVKRIVLPILKWLIWIYVKEINGETSSAETYMSLVTVPPQNLKTWHKLRLQWENGKWPESHRVAEPQINAESSVA